MFNKIDLKTHIAISRIIALLCFSALLTETIAYATHPISWQHITSLMIFTLGSILLLCLTSRSFILFYLLSTFTLIASWRLAALASFTTVTWILTLSMALKLGNYLLLARRGIITHTSLSSADHQVTRFEWQLFFIRLFIGFDLIPHFCEKLFAGPSIRANDVAAFTQLGVPHADTFVIIAGLIEFAGALSLSCGFITRLGAICLSIYMLTATYLGHHFSKGFIWASQGGGWEYPVLWTTLILSFAVFGAGDFSIDRLIKDRWHLPRLMRLLLGGRHD